ncbi:MAG: hypothetical protein HKN23_07570 [Verrucomicrobiales bacterium]|nr:hypothetical protein [Verrucomicrobiales bacterium]
MKNRLPLTQIFAFALLAPILCAQTKRTFREIAPLNEASKSEIAPATSTPVASPPAKADSSTTPDALPAHDLEGKAESLDARPRSPRTAIRDSVTAAALAWEFFDREDFVKAQQWFTHSVEWNPNNLHAVEGLILAMFEGGEPQTAYLIADKFDDRITGIRALVVESATNRARQFLEAGQFAEAKRWVTGYPSSETGFRNIYAEVSKAEKYGGALKLATVNGAPAGKNPNLRDVPVISTEKLLELAEGAMQEGRHRICLMHLQQVEARGELTRSARILKGWNLFHTRRYDEGADVFESLYRENADLESAEGLSVCLQQTQQYEKLSALSKELGGLLIGTSGPVLREAERIRQRQAPEGSVGKLVDRDSLQIAPSSSLEHSAENPAIKKPVEARLQATR